MTTQEQAEQLAIDAVTKFTVPFDEVCVRVRKDIILSTIPLVELLECVSELRRAGRGSYVDFDAIDKSLAKLDAKLKGTK